MTTATTIVASPDLAPTSSVDHKELTNSSASGSGKRIKWKKLFSKKKKKKSVTKEKMEAEAVGRIKAEEKAEAVEVPPSLSVLPIKDDPLPSAPSPTSVMDATAPMDDSMSMNGEDSVFSDGGSTHASTSTHNIGEDIDSCGGTVFKTEDQDADGLSKLTENVFSPMDWLCSTGTDQGKVEEAHLENASYSPEAGFVRTVGNFPELSEDSVLIQVETTTISTRDSLERLRRANTKELKAELWVPGHEIVGLVVRVGTNADKFLLGKRVAAVLPFGGGCAQYVCIDAKDVIAVPAEASSNEVVALLSTYLTAYQCLESAAAKEEADVEQEESPLSGKSVLIFGAGSPLGLAFVDLAKNAGATVYTVSHSSHLDAITEMGADHWYRLSQKEEWSEQWKNKIDLVVDTVGNHDDSDNKPSFYNVMKTGGGRLATVNITSCEKKYLPLTRAKSCAFYKSVVNEKAFEYDMFKSFDGNQDLFTQDLAKLYDLHKTGKIGPKIYSRVGFDEMQSEWEKVMRGRTNGVVVVSPWK
ncbi:medium chain reductase/dehydrogenase (MDR)/zinc-dependent alcohol dehydrogenase-like family protein [Skeletonema marinoi]|uniref:Medium chain reductase/dehydrogenase (MDR)/zinc-dependent alcohol dehydrogenase-like family protein n=1 Tax=Skeletonema marinoi TaxID=267567 RepID=A0AAD8YD89_9STRA|nr:medium chain reductase/dehydrogenase (MDR)/zinc-dependent alcohol dehydrogenase-like family protein [Skeletonema marinoi]